jgi:quercetin dioxygenase-like cupin family protein
MKLNREIAFVLVASFLAAGCETAGHEALQAGYAWKSPDVHHDDAQGGPLLIEELSNPVGHEVRMATIEYPPGGSTAPHRHAGAIFAYVLSGNVIVQLDGGNHIKYGPGEAWSERPGQLHEVSRNASLTEPAKLLVLMITDPDKPQLSFDR